MHAYLRWCVCSQHMCLPHETHTLGNTVLTAYIAESCKHTSTRKSSKGCKFLYKVEKKKAQKKELTLLEAAGEAKSKSKVSKEFESSQVGEISMWTFNQIILSNCK